MRQMKMGLYYVFGEPLMWLFYWCFQPDRFVREFEIRTAFKRVKPSLRLAFLIFLIDYPIALFARWGLHIILRIPSPHIMNFIISITLATLVGAMLGLFAGIGLGLTGGISIGLSSCLGFGLVVSSVDHTNETHILGGIAAGLVITCMLSVAGKSAGNAVILGIIAGVVAGIATGVATNLTIGNDVGDMILSCMVGMTMGITISKRKARPLGGAHPRSRSLLIGIILTGVMVLLITWIGSLIFACIFFLIFYRLPLYPVSGFSSWRALRASRKSPSQVFTYLHGSSLYWDEYVYLPLPGLTQMLTIAAEQHVERALEEISFIVMERPLQINAARFASLEIAFHSLGMCDTLRNIAGASLRLSEIFPHGTGLIDPQWSMILVHLHDASENAAQACSPVGWQAKHNALEAMLTDLKRIRPNTAFNDVEMNKRLADIVTLWQDVALRELDVLEKAPEKTRRISNPYNPGPALERYNRLFVGRYDLASYLGEALARRDHRPTFLLHGERRMGKSSVLKHLPDLLGARFLPVFYDLQSPDTTSSIAAFFGMVAEEIVLVMEARGLKARKLEYERLQEARRENEAAVYYVFNKWLKGIEKTLEREDRTLLLTFDEFENLDNAGKEGNLRLELLLNWFRSIMQHHPRLALLFSGVQTFGEMG
ncbi:MAG: ATP-binding protein, partial [Ktedonobacteraceae bacterium]|nr:ATP-binding protein [Ktedonobacteraceae bacterium]